MKKDSTRVLILGDGSLFDNGLTNLLTHEDSIVVSNLTYSSDVTFVSEFMLERPEVLVLFEGGPLSVSRVFELIEDVPELTHLRVITVLSDNNSVYVYEKLKVSATHIDGFVTLIRQNALVT